MLRVSVCTEGLESIKEKLAQSCTEAEHMVSIQVQKDTSPFVPASGAPAGMDTRTKVDGSMVIYPGPYARYLYLSKLMVDPETGSSYAKKGRTKVLTDKNLVFSKAMHAQAQAYWFEASKAQNLDKWIRVAEKAVEHGR